MEKYKLINVRIFHPAHKTTKQRCEFTYCNNSENCELHKNKKCVHDFRYFGHICCPHGKFRKEEGYTQKAKSFSEWMNKRREQFKDIVDCVEFVTDKLAVAGEYVYLPYPHLENYVNQISGIVNKHFIKAEEFTVEKIKEITDFKPQALMGGIIYDYQSKYVPKFIQHLKEIMPDKYNAFIQAYPDRAKEFEAVTANHTGRKAYINTLSAGAVINERNGVFVYDGEYLTCENYADVFAPFKADKIVYRIKPDSNAVVVITDNAQVNENTKFAD